MVQKNMILFGFLIFDDPTVYIYQNRMEGGILEMFKIGVRKGDNLKKIKHVLLRKDEKLKKIKELYIRKDGKLKKIF